MSGDMQSPLAGPDDMQSFGPETCKSGITLTPDEARTASVGLHIAAAAFSRDATFFGGGAESDGMAGRLRALAARLEAAS